MSLRPANTLRMAGFLLALTCPCLAQSGSASLLITPESAIRQALEANLDYLNLIDRTEMAQLDFASARAAYKRKFRVYSTSDARSGTAVGTVSSLSMSKRMESGSAFSAELYNASFGDSNLSEFRLGYTLPMFRSRLDNTRMRIEQAEMSYTQRQRLQQIGAQELTHRVMTSYLDLILRHHLERLAENEYQLGQSRHQALAIRAGGGEVSEVDLEQVELRVNQAEHALEMAKFNRRSAENGFKILLGIELERPIVIDTDIPENRHVDLLDQSLADLESHAFANRPEILGMAEELSLAETALDAQAGSRFPPMEITLQYAFANEDNSLFPAMTVDDHRLGVGISLDTELGSSAEARNRRKKYLELRTMHREFEQLKSQVLMEVRRAFFDLQHSQGKLHLKRSARRLNERKIEQVSIQFESGETDVLSLLEAEQSLEQAKYDELGAQIEYLQAGQALAMASGHFE